MRSTEVGAVRPSANFRPASKNTSYSREGGKLAEGRTAPTSVERNISKFPADLFAPEEILEIFAPFLGGLRGREAE